MKTHKVQPIEQVVLHKRDGSSEVIEVAEDGHVILAIAHIKSEDDEQMDLEINKRILTSMQVRMAVVKIMHEDIRDAMKAELPEGLADLIDALENALKD